MTKTDSDPLAGVDCPDLPRPDWLQLRYAPIWFAYNPSTGLGSVPFTLPEELKAAGVTSEVDWARGRLSLDIPSEQVRDGFAEPIGVAAYSNGDGVLWLYGPPMNFLRVDYARVADLTTPDIAQAIKGSTEAWWKALTRQAEGSLRHIDIHPRAKCVVARVGSPVAPRFTRIPGDAFDALAITDWRKGMAASLSGLTLYAMHLVKAEAAHPHPPSLPNSAGHQTDPQARVALRLPKARGVTIPRSGARWVRLLAKANEIAQETDGLPFNLTADALRMEHKRQQKRHQGRG